MGLSKSRLQHQRTRSLLGTRSFQAKQSAIKRWRPPKGQVTELICSKLFFKLLQKGSPGIAKGNQFTTEAILACNSIPLDKNISHIHSPQR